MRAVLKLFDHPPLIRSFNHGKETTLNFVSIIDLSVAENGGCFVAIFVTLKNQSRAVLHICFHDPLSAKYLTDT